MIDAKDAHEISVDEYNKKQEADFERFKPIVEKAIMKAITQGDFVCSMSGNVAGNKLIATWLKSLGYKVHFDTRDFDGERVIYIKW